SVVSGSFYEMRVTGVSSNGTLNLRLAMFDASGNQLGTAATATDTSPLTGGFFGYRSRSVTSGAVSASYDYLSIYVPAPTSAPSFVTLPQSQTKFIGDNITFTTL